jgi:hypothetical protein
MVPEHRRSQVSLRKISKVHQEQLIKKWYLRSNYRLESLRTWFIYLIYLFNLFI